MALLVLLECSISNSVVTDFSEIIRPGLGCIIFQISNRLHPQMRMCFLPSSDVTSILFSFRLVVNRSHFSSIPDLKVAAPGVLVSPVALSRVRLTPEINAAHPAQSGRTSAHQNPKGYFLEASIHQYPFIFGTFDHSWHFVFGVLLAFYLALEKS